ncbi:MAG TPA: EAL domain-containing protein [Azospirillaceae bacterium]|nr:EAL domain-containing protein [Azospirillaceae bacterium]
MSLLRHIVFAAVYSVLALVLALTLPMSAMGLDRPTALLFGLAVFVFGALLHEFYARQEQADRIERRVWRLKERQDEILQAIERLTAKLEGAEPGAQAGAPLNAEVQAVMTEARVLETLAGQLPPTRAAAPAAPEPAEEPVQPAPARRAPEPSFRSAGALRPLTATFQETTPDDAAVIETIRQALRTDRLDALLQPIVSLPQRKHRYYEVFTRIRTEDGGTLLPDQYLPAAERHDLIAAIDNILLFRCVQLIRETEKRHQNVGFFCNISAATLNDAVFMREFVTFMGQNPNLASKLVFELAQADLMQGGVLATGFLDGLRRLGFRFSMDQVERYDMDWDQLARHEIRYLKLDAARLLDPDGRFARPDAVTELKRQLDRNSIDLIVEKIETDQQLLELLDLYIDFGQGYLFGEPRAAKKLS